jgi:hypothetical protein
MTLITLNSCAGQNNQIPPIDDRDFASKWYQGLAEISSYELKQARYGEIHPGEAVLIFVTEDFSKSKQVKLDQPGAHQSDAITVLKMNATRSFNTGVYQYNMMQSVFTPVSFDQYPKSLKVSTSSQDWCGHSWMQYNLERDKYKATQFSYFENEGDQSFLVEAAFLEDEIWTKIRTAPHMLPTGNFQVIPGTFFSRMRHNTGKSTIAHGSIEKRGNEYVYKLDYQKLDRELNIFFSAEFPHEISGWEETSKSGFGQDAKTLTTKATLKKRIMLDYWRRHNLSDRSLRAELGMSE